MKKLILTAAAAVAAFAGVNAQVSDASQYTINVPQILSITTSPTNATFTHNLTEGQLTAGKDLQTVEWTVKSNGMWKASAAWSVTGSAASSGNAGLLPSSINNFRNALQFSADGTNWMSLPASPTSVNPIPGFGSVAPTSTTGATISLMAHLNAMDFTVVPGTYTATTTITVTAL